MTTADPILVKAQRLTFQRGSRYIFDNADIDIPRGKITGIIGPSGCGKTTLLKLIGGQLRPASGSVYVDGIEVAKLKRGALMQLRQRMGMLFQTGALLTDLSVFENVAFPMREHLQLPQSSMRDLVLMKLEAVGLRGAHTLMPHELSGGMARRVALARAIALDPDLMMYDEPFAGQDPISMGVLLRLIRLMNNAFEMTSIVVSHDIAELLTIADYVYVLQSGKVMGQGTPAELAANSSAWVHQFIHGEADGPVRFHFPAAPIQQDLG